MPCIRWASGEVLHTPRMAHTPPSKAWVVAHEFEMQCTAASISVLDILLLPWLPRPPPPPPFPRRQVTLLVSWAKVTQPASGTHTMT